MSPPALPRKEVSRSPMGNAELRVNVVGPLNSRSRAMHRRVCDLGMTVEPLLSSLDCELDIGHLDPDVLIVLIDSTNAQADMERLRSWRQRGIVLPIITVAPLEMATVCLDAGADDCVLPSVETRELEARIRARIRRIGSKPKVLRVYDLEIDTQSRDVSRSGQAIHLTPREFAILEILASHRGKVVTRVMIWQRLYRETERYASNVVDVYIRYLRQKIDKDFTPPLILTAWGRGYMLRGDEEDSTP